MKLKHLQTFTSPSQVDENRDEYRKEYDDSSDFEAAHSKISALLKQVKMLVDSQQHENWMLITDENYDTEAHDIWADLSQTISKANKLNNELYSELMKAE